MRARADEPNAGVLLLAQIGFAGLQSIASIVVARALQPTQRGELAFIVVTTVLASQLFERGGEYGAIQLRQDGTRMAQLLTTRGLLLAQGFASISAGIILLLKADDALMALGGALLAASGIVSRYLVGALTVEGRSWLVVFVRLWPPAILLVGAVVYLAANLYGIGPIVIALCAGQMTAMPLALAIRHLRPSSPVESPTHPTHGDAVDLQRLHLGNTGIYALYRCDQFILGLFGFQAQLGLYAVAVNIAEATQYIPTVATTLLITRDRNRRRQTRQVALWTTAVLAVIIAVTGHWAIVLLYGESYGGASRYLPPLLAAYLLFSVARLAWGDLLRERAYAPFAHGSLVAAAIGIPAIAAMVRVAGAMGAAWGSLLSYFVLAAALVCCYRWSTTGRGVATAEL